MAVLKILVLFLLVGNRAKLVVSQTSEEYYEYTDVSEEAKSTKVPADNELTHVHTKNLSGNVKLTTLQVLPTNPPLDKNNVFENDKEFEATTVPSDENKQAEVQTVPENQHKVPLLSELGTKDPTDGKEWLGLMDVVNGTSGTSPDRASEEKLITATPPNFEQIREDEVTTEKNVPGDEDVLGAKGETDSENFTQEGTDIGANEPNPSGNILPETVTAESTTLETSQETFTSMQDNRTVTQESTEEIEPSTFDSDKYQTQRIISGSDDGLTTLTDSESSTLKESITENNTYETKTNTDFYDTKHLDIETTSEGTTVIPGRDLVVDTSANLDQSREDIENLSSFLNVDEELLSTVTDQTEAIDEIIEDLSMLLDNYENVDKRFELLTDSATIVSDVTGNFSENDEQNVDQEINESTTSENAFTLDNQPLDIQTEDTTTDQATILSITTLGRIVTEEQNLDQEYNSSTTLENEEIFTQSTFSTILQQTNLDEDMTDQSTVTTDTADVTVADFIVNSRNLKEETTTKQSEEVEQKYTTSEMFSENTAGQTEYVSTTFATTEPELLQKGETELQQYTTEDEVNTQNMFNEDNSTEYSVLGETRFDDENVGRTFQDLDSFSTDLVDEQSTEGMSEKDTSTKITEFSTLSKNGFDEQSRTSSSQEFSVEEESTQSTIQTSQYFEEISTTTTDVEYSTRSVPDFEENASTVTTQDEFTFQDLVTERSNHSSTFYTTTVFETVDFTTEGSAKTLEDNLEDSDFTDSTSMDESQSTVSQTDEISTAESAETTFSTIQHSEDSSNIVSTTEFEAFTTENTEVFKEIYTSLQPETTTDFYETESTTMTQEDVSGTTYTIESTTSKSSLEDDSKNKLQEKFTNLFMDALKYMSDKIKNATKEYFKNEIDKSEDNSKIIFKETQTENVNDDFYQTDKTDNAEEQVTSNTVLKLGDLINDKENEAILSDHGMNVDESEENFTMESGTEDLSSEIVFPTEDPNIGSDKPDQHKDVQMSSISDSLINSLHQKVKESDLENATDNNKDPQISTKVDGKAINFSVKISDNATSYFVPSEAFLIIQSPNNFNITWKSSVANMNNSLGINLDKSVQLNLVEGNQTQVYKSVLIPETKNKLYVDKSITLDDGVQIYFSNTEFLKTDQGNGTAYTALPSAPKETQTYTAEIIGGCLGIFLITSILVYCAVMKFKGKTRIFKPNSTAYVFLRPPVPKTSRENGNHPCVQKPRTENSESAAIVRKQQCPAGQHHKKVPFRSARGAGRGKPAEGANQGGLGADQIPLRHRHRGHREYRKPKTGRPHPQEAESAEEQEFEQQETEAFPATLPRRQANHRFLPNQEGCTS